MTTSNKILVLTDKGPIATASSNAIGGFTDIMGGISNVTSNRIRTVRLRSFISSSKIRPGSINAIDPIPAPMFTVASMPDATSLFGHYIYVIDATGGPVMAFSDGVNWRSWVDRIIIE
jgi:hypothetical protein